MARRHGGSSQQVLDARGKEIVRSGTILDIGSAKYKVSSQSVADAFYDVSFGPDGWRCTCQYHLHGARRCKHIRAVYGTIMCERRLADERREGMAVAEPRVTCRFCHSTDCTRRGTRKNKNGTVFRYGCGGCRRRFTHNPGFVGRHHPPEVITDALQEYAAGLSTNRISDCLAKNGTGVSASTVWRWARDYGKLLERFQKTCMAAGYTWHADEIYFKVRERPMWMFGVMDAETKLIMAHEIVQHKIGYDATRLFEAAIKAAGRRPDVLITDGLAGFKTGYRKAMYTRAMPRNHPHGRHRHTGQASGKQHVRALQRGDSGQDSPHTRVQVRGSRAAWPAGHIPQLHAPARRLGRQDSGRGSRDHDNRP